VPEPTDSAVAPQKESLLRKSAYKVLNGHRPEASTGSGKRTSPQGRVLGRVKYNGKVILYHPSTKDKIYVGDTKSIHTAYNALA